MPLFDYLCKSCEAKPEILVRGRETVKCPACGSTKLVKLASTFAAVKSSAPSSKSSDSSGPSCCRGCRCH